METGSLSSMIDSYKIDAIPVGTSREVNLDYKIKGEPKFLDFVAGDRVIGKLILK